MQEELFDVVDAEDRVIGQAPRSEVHAHRWLHRAVHIFVFNPAGELLIHQRSATKDEYPLRFNSSASGHLHAGEDYDAAAVRELAEELSLSSPLVRLTKFPAGPLTSYEHTVLYRTTTAERPTFLAEEILAGDFHPLEQIAAWMAARPDEFTPCFRTLFQWYSRSRENIVGRRDT